MSKRRLAPRPWAAILWLAIALPAQAADFAALCTDRAAIERVYYSHRLGTKPPFEQTMPDATIERLVREDLHRQAVLAKVYGVAITPAMLAIETARIDTTTRAPDVLAELKAALGNDGERFARSVVRPIVVEQTLRRRFDNDETLHLAQRRDAERAREAALSARQEGATKQIGALSAKNAGTVLEATWQLAPRPAQQAAGASPAASGVAPPSPANGVAKSSSYTIQATTQLAQVLAPPDRSAHADDQLWLEDLDPELQQVLRAQLHTPGDVSAVIETPGGFLVVVARDRNATVLSAATLSIRKRSYEQWLAAQPE